MLIVAHNNPAAKVSTSLKSYMKNTLESAYLGQNFFWSMAPAGNDFILFEFLKPTVLRKYYIKSGNPEHPDDRLYNASLQIRTERAIPSDKLPKTYTKLNEFYCIDKFSNSLGVVSGLIDPQVTGPITHVRIHIPVARQTWVIISEIDFATQIESKSAVSKMISA